MAGSNIFLLCLGVLALSWMVNGQFQSFFNQQLGFNFQKREAETAVCRAVVRLRRGKDGDRDKSSRLIIEATVRMASKSWFSRRPELEIKVTSDIPLKEDCSIILTEFGATGREDGCTNENLGDILTGRRQFNTFRHPWFQSKRSDGVLASFNLEDGEFTEIFDNLPISSVQEIFGCGLALCTEIDGEEDDRDNDGHDVGDEDENRWGWPSWPTQSSHNQWSDPWSGSDLSSRRSIRKSTCTGEIPICCTFGKFDGDVD